MKGVVLFFLFFCLTVNCGAADRVYTDADLKPEPPIYSTSPQSAVSQPYVQKRGFYQQRETGLQPHVFYGMGKTTPQQVEPANPSAVHPKGTFEQLLAETLARLTLFVLLIVGIPFLLWIICLVDVLRNEFTGNNKIIWFLLVLFLPVLGAILYFFIGTDQKIRPEDDEEPVVRLI